MNSALDNNLVDILGITHIVNASNGEAPNKFSPSIAYCNINIEDDNKQDILPFFDVVYQFLCPEASQSENLTVGIESASNEKQQIDENMTKDSGIDSEITENCKTLDINNDISDNTTEISINILHANSLSLEETVNNVIDEATKTELPGDDITTNKTDLIPINFTQKCILFHCKLGISRSASLVVAFLMKSQGYSLKDAYCMVKSKRPKILPTIIFANALQIYEKQIFPNISDNTISMFAMTGVRINSLPIERDATDKKQKNDNDQDQDEKKELTENKKKCCNLNPCCLS